MTKYGVIVTEINRFHCVVEADSEEAAQEAACNDFEEKSKPTTCPDFSYYPGGEITVDSYEIHI